MILFHYDLSHSVAPTPSFCTSSKRTSSWVTNPRRRKLLPLHQVTVQHVAISAFIQVFLHPEVEKKTITHFLLCPDFQPPPFSEKFFLVVIEKDLNRNSVLQMWHLHLKSVQACVGRFTVNIVDGK